METRRNVERGTDGSTPCRTYRQEYIEGKQGDLQIIDSYTLLNEASSEQEAIKVFGECERELFSDHTCLPQTIKRCDEIMLFDSIMMSILPTWILPLSTDRSVRQWCPDLLLQTSSLPLFMLSH